MMRSSLRDIALAGQDGVEGLVGLSEDAKHVVRLTDEEHQALRLKPRTLVVAPGQLVSWSSHAARPRARTSWVGLDRPSGPPYNAWACSRGLRTCVVMTRSSVRTSGHEEVWVCCTTDSCGSL